MKIIDAQLHDPAPWGDWSQQAESTQNGLLTELSLAYLDALGIQGVILFTNGEWAASAAREYPDRIAQVPSITPDIENIDAAVSQAKHNHANGQLGLRAVIGWPLDGTEVRRLEQGAWEPIFAACEAHQVPLFLFITRALPLAADILERHPKLTVIIDHLGLRQPPMDEPDSPPFKSLPELLELARFPNVAVKLCGLPALSKEPYPYSDVLPELRAMIDAFGAQRLMWASDIGRFYGRIGLGRFENPRAIGDYPGKHSYTESLNFIRYCDELTLEEKEWILEKTVRRLLQWGDD